MTKKTLIIILIVAVVIIGVGLYFQNQRNSNIVSPTQVKSLVEEFGKKLQNVYLTSPEEKVRQDIEENYQDFLSPSLLALWLENPSQALGRLTSSPWPDRIEVDSIEKINDSEYQVNGKVIEITSVEAVEGGAATSRDIKLTVEKINGKWLISEVIVRGYKEVKTYTNSLFGIEFDYPKNFIPYLRDNEYIGGEPSRFTTSKDLHTPLDENSYFVINLSGAKSYECNSSIDSEMSYFGSYEDIQQFIQEGKPINFKDCKETIQTIDQIAKNSAYHKLLPFGENPTINKLEIEAQEARLIIPSDTGINETELIVRLKNPVLFNNNYWTFLIIHVSQDIDGEVIKMISKSLHFI